MSGKSRTQKKERQMTKARKPLIAALIFQSILAIGQWFNQGSLLGYWFLGETTLTYTANIAKTSVWPFEGLRILPYGTTPHPNVLAGWALVSLLILLRLRKVSSPARSPYSYLPLIFTTILVSLTQSRSAALVLFGFVIPFALLRSWRPRLLYFVLLLTTSYSRLLPCSGQ